MPIPIIFANIAWMNEYKGVNENDRMFSDGFRHFKENEEGGEQYNFFLVENANKYYGYVANIGSEGFKRININKLGANDNDESIDGVSVVFFARHPSLGIPYIVGWYRNATVYREAQVRSINNDNDKRYFETNNGDAILVPADERNFVIPHTNIVDGGYGQSPIWYADRLREFIEDVQKYINGENYNNIYLHINNDENINKWNNNEYLDKAEVEKIAVTMTRDYFYNKGFNVTSVETENCGWDLTVRRGRTEFFVEVKGTTSERINVILTPNEYNNLRRYHNQYKLSVVTNCQKDPNLNLFSIERDNNQYYALNENASILLVEHTAAICSEN